MQSEATHESLPAVYGSTVARPIGRETTSENAFGLTIHIRAVAGLLLFSLGLTLALLLWSAKRQDEITIAGSRHLAESALGVVSGNLGQTVTDYTYWDDAYKYIAEDFSQVWYEENLAISEYLGDNFGITSTFVISPDNQVLRHMHDGQPFADTEALDLTRHVEGGILALVDRARRNEDGKFRPSTGLLRVGGRPFFAAARIINPHTDERRAQAGVTPENGYVTIFMRPLDDELLQSIATDFGWAYPRRHSVTGFRFLFLIENAP